ncbi:MAG TPA: ATP-binding protein [Anaerolineaceae bacterium]|nr:ATP-binding protein [Anaerolineaceae bacterium]
MKTSITLKLALAFIGVSLLTGLALAFFVRSLISDNFERYLLDQQAETKLILVEDFYAQNGTWDGVEQVLSSAPGVMEGHGAGRGQGQGGSQTQPGVQAGPRTFGLADADGMVLVGLEELYPTGSKLTQDQLESGVPVLFNGARVGTLLSSRSLSYSGLEQNFLDQVNLGLLWTLLAAVLVVSLLSLLVSGSLTRPIKALTTASRNLAEGKRTQLVEVSSSDELGELGTSFNRMSLEIESAERLRKQMTADVAHDLRTPLTVIGGYVEAARDGALELTPERLDVLGLEVNRLNRLVSDLRTMSQSDSGELLISREAVEPAGLLTKIREVFRLQAEQKGITLAVRAAGGLPILYGDEGRLMQVLENLVANAIRHTPNGGEINLGVSEAKNSTLLFSVADSGEGIPAEELPLIFERFHRVDKSRHADSNQSGLGLAIARAIVEAHGGRIWAESKPGKGTTIRFEIPLA